MLFAVLLVGFLLTGCDNSNYEARNKLIGKWEIDKKLLFESILIAIQEEDGSIDDRLLESFEKQITDARIELEFLAAGEFKYETQTDILDEQSANVESGIWEVHSVDERTVKLTLSKTDRMNDCSVIFIRSDLIETTGFTPKLSGMPDLHSNAPVRFTRVY